MACVFGLQASFMKKVCGVNPAIQLAEPWVQYSMPNFLTANMGKDALQLSGRFWR